MKKRMLSIFLLLALFLTACQATPEADIVVQKNTEQMIEVAKATPEPDAMQTPQAEPGKSALYATLGIPEVYEATLTNAAGKLTVYVDVRPEVPEADALPVARVVPADFSQGTVTALYDYLIGDTPMFEQPSVPDKIMLEKEMLMWRQALAGPDSQHHDFYEKVLKDLEKQYKTAPDRHAPIPADATLKSRRAGYEETDVLDGISTYVNIVADIYGGGKSFFTQNNTKYENEGSYSYIDGYGNTQMFTQRSYARFSYDRDRDETMLYQQSGYVYEDATEASLTSGAPAESLLTVTPKEARAQAQALLDAIGADDMEIESVHLMSSVYWDTPMWLAAGYENEREWTDAGSPSPYGEERQGYAVVCLHNLNGVRVASDLDETTVDGTTNSASWHNEKLFIGVDDEGISGVNWEAPITVTEIVTENANVKPFGEIREIIEKMMFIIFEPYAQKYTITSVRLSLQRISEQDSFTSGLLAPVWNVYGYQTVFRKDKNQSEDYPVSLWPLLTINAIDGSVIDIYKGY